MSESAVARAYAEIDRLKDRLAFCTEAEADARSELAQVAAEWRKFLREQAMSAPYQGLGPTLAECLTAEKIALTAELCQVKAGWAEDDARLQRAEEGWAEASERLAQVKAERDEARALLAGWPDARVSKAEAERDTALRHLQAVLEWSNTERFAGRTRHENDAPSAARAFLLSMREKADTDE